MKRTAALFAFGICAASERSSEYLGHDPLLRNPQVNFDLDSLSQGNREGLEENFSDLYPIFEEPPVGVIERQLQAVTTPPPPPPPEPLNEETISLVPAGQFLDGSFFIPAEYLSFKEWKQLGIELLGPMYAGLDFEEELNRMIESHRKVKSKKNFRGKKFPVPLPLPPWDTPIETILSKPGFGPPIQSVLRGPGLEPPVGPALLIPIESVMGGAETILGGPGLEPPAEILVPIETLMGIPGILSAPDGTALLFPFETVMAGLKQNGDESSVLLLGAPTFLSQSEVMNYLPKAGGLLRPSV